PGNSMAPASQGDLDALFAPEAHGVEDIRRRAALCDHRRALVDHAVVQTASVLVLVVTGCKETAAEAGTEVVGDVDALSVRHACASCRCHGADGTSAAC